MRANDFVTSVLILMVPLASNSELRSFPFDFDWQVTMGYSILCPVEKSFMFRKKKTILEGKKLYHYIYISDTEHNRQCDYTLQISFSSSQPNSGFRN